jgi:small subunit ribosomal protein S8
MTTTSNLANFISNLNNHSQTNKKIMIQSYNKLIINLLNLLVNEGFLRYIQIDEKIVTIFLKFNKNHSVFQKIKLISKPGKRIYVNNTWFYQNRKNGTFILSTSKGLLTHIQAKQLNVGGELICQII